jgi:DinB superfamily
MDATMTPHERQLVLDQLASSEARLLALVADLTPQQWSYREAPTRWSIADNIEHCILFEEFIRGAIAKVLQAPPEPEKKSQAATKDPLVHNLATSRSTKFNAREALHPTCRWPDPTDMLAELRKTRAQTIAFAAETQANLRDHFFPHIAFGDLDCYQWLVVLGQHAARHALQIEEIKADPAYPAT